MERKAALLIAFAWLLLAASSTMSADASAGARLLLSEQVYYPQGCRCCLFTGRVPNIRCARTCCSSPRGENCCI